MELCAKRTKLGPEEISSELENSQTSESEQSSIFDESQMEKIREIFPDFERDIHFGGHERLIYFDSEFSHQNSNTESLKYENLTVKFFWINKNEIDGLGKINYVLRSEQITHFSKLLQYGNVLQNKKTYDFFEFMDTHFDFIMDSKFKESVRCIETDSEFEYLEKNGDLFNSQIKILTNEFIHREYDIQQEILNRDYYGIFDNDIHDILEILFFKSIKLSVVGKDIFIYCDLLYMYDESITVSIDFRINKNQFCYSELRSESNSELRSEICVIRKEIIDPNYGGPVYMKYYFEQYYLRQHIPYFAKYDDKEIVYFDRNYHVLGDPTNARNLRDKFGSVENYTRFFNDGTSPLHGGDISLLREISKKIKSEGLDKLVCLNPHPEMQKLLQIASE